MGRYAETSDEDFGIGITQKYFHDSGIKLFNCKILTKVNFYLIEKYCFILSYLIQNVHFIIINTCSYNTWYLLVLICFIILK